MQVGGILDITLFFGLAGVLGVDRGRWYRAERVGKLRKEPVGYGAGCSERAWEMVYEEQSSCDDSGAEGQVGDGSIRELRVMNVSAHPSLD